MTSEATQTARERFPAEQYPDDPSELKEGESYLRERPDGTVVTVTVLEVRGGNAKGRGIVTITQETD